MATLLALYADDRKQSGERRLAVAATLIGIVGCTALVVSAFALLMTFKDTAAWHFSHIALYDDNLFYDSSVPDAQEKLEKAMDEAGTTDYLAAYQGAFVIDAGESGMKIATVIVPQDTSRLTDFFSLRGVSGRKKLTLRDDGILLSYTYSKYFGTSAGDTIKLMDLAGDSYTCAVTGITDHYLSNYQIIMSPNYYESIMGEPAVNNSFFIRLNGADEATLIDKLESVDGFYSVSNDNAKWTEIFGSLMQSISVVAYISVLVAFCMAMLVLLNLNIMFVNEKARELIIMRVNGYGLRDAKKYIYRDNIVLTTIGTVLGIGVGILFGLLILHGIEREGTNYYSAPNLVACLIGAASSAVFALITNLIALRRVKQLKLSDLSRL